MALRAMTALSVLIVAACPQPSAAQETLLERGRYLVETVAFCGVCHNTPDANGKIIPEMELAGGRVIKLDDMRSVLPDLPLGDIRAVVPNITPDPETGIGRWTDTQIATAIREGRRPDGSIIGPPMPIALYRGISDNDLTAIVTYLRTVPPKHNAVTQHSTYPIPIEPYGPRIDHVADPADNPVARGAYIAGPLAHCMDCHTPVLSLVQRDWSRMGAGGMPLKGPLGIVVAANITPDKQVGIGDLTDDQIRNAITKGVAPDGHHLVGMQVRAPIYSRITAGDMRDLIAYLRSLPAQ
jgi:cytochrome c553